jgi:peptidoglycan-N-acetylglucosamine deacetylase
MIRNFIFLLLFFCRVILAHGSVDVAITIDDLPRHGPVPEGVSRRELSKQMLSTLRAHGVPGVYGFINAKKVDDEPDLMEVLKDWISVGYYLGNHTYSHSNLSKVSSTEFIEDIRANENILSQLGKAEDFKFFRYPFLREGNTSEKRAEVRKFLFKEGYAIAEVTVDFEDYAWNAPYVRCLEKNDSASIVWLKSSFLENAVARLKISQQLSRQIFGRPIKHVLLLHLGIFDQIMLDDLLKVYRGAGVRFVGLREALTDSIYRLDSGVAIENGATLLDVARQ